MSLGKSLSSRRSLKSFLFIHHWQGAHWVDLTLKLLVPVLLIARAVLDPAIPPKFRAALGLA